MGIHINITSYFSKSATKRYWLFRYSWPSGAANPSRDTSVELFQSCSYACQGEDDELGEGDKRHSCPAPDGGANVSHEGGQVCDLHLLVRRVLHLIEEEIEPDLVLMFWHSQR
jgi:hypothetical protein